MTSYQDVSDKTPPLVRYQSDDLKREFLDRLLERPKGVNERPDGINRSNQSDGEQRNRISVMERSERALSRIAAREPVDLPAVEFFPDVSFIRVLDGSGHREIYTVIRNRMHSNVAFMFGESLRYKPDQDALIVYPGVLASYPNFMFNLRVDDIDAFVNTLFIVEDERMFTEAIIKQWGVRRTHPRFWDLFHDVTAYLEEQTPTDAGVMDMSRYENL